MAESNASLGRPGRRGQDTRRRHRRIDRRAIQPARLTLVDPPYPHHRGQNDSCKARDRGLRSASTRRKGRSRLHRLNTTPKENSSAHRVSRCDRGEGASVTGREGASRRVGCSPVGMEALVRPNTAKKSNREGRGRTRRAMVGQRRRARCCQVRWRGTMLSWSCASMSCPPTGT